MQLLTPSKAGELCQLCGGRPVYQGPLPLHVSPARLCPRCATGEHRAEIEPWAGTAPRQWWSDLIAGMTQPLQELCQI